MQHIPKKSSSLFVPCGREVLSIPSQYLTIGGGFTKAPPAEASHYNSLS